MRNQGFRFIIFSAAAYSLLGLGLFSQESYVCVWRNPEITMHRIFSEAVDYRTVVKKISQEMRSKIEKRLGEELLPGQRDTFQYYEMIDRQSQVIGYTIAASQKGKYGAIEFVFGLGIDLKIKEIYIQRAREKEKEFKKKTFLNLFSGKSAADIDGIVLGNEMNIKETVGALAVLNGIRKELIAFNMLNRAEP